MRPIKYRIEPDYQNAFVVRVRPWFWWTRCMTERGEFQDEDPQLNSTSPQRFYSVEEAKHAIIKSIWREAWFIYKRKSNEKRRKFHRAAHKDVIVPPWNLK